MRLIGADGLSWRGAAATARRAELLVSVAAGSVAGSGQAGGVGKACSAPAAAAGRPGSGPGGVFWSPSLYSLSGGVSRRSSGLVGLARRLEGEAAAAARRLGAGAVSKRYGEDVRPGAVLERRLGSLLGGDVGLAQAEAARLAVQKRARGDAAAIFGELWRGKSLALVAADARFAEISRDKGRAGLVAALRAGGIEVDEGAPPMSGAGDVGVTRVSEPESGRTVSEHYDYQHDLYRMEVQTKDGAAVALPARDGSGRRVTEAYDLASRVTTTRREDDPGTGTVVEQSVLAEGVVLERTRVSGEETGAWVIVVDAARLDLAHGDGWSHAADIVERRFAARRGSGVRLVGIARTQVAALGRAALAETVGGLEAALQDVGGPVGAAAGERSAAVVRLKGEVYTQARRLIEDEVGQASAGAERRAAAEQATLALAGQVLDGARPFVLAAGHGVAEGSGGGASGGLPALTVGGAAADGLRGLLLAGAGEGRAGEAGAALAGLVLWQAQTQENAMIAEAMALYADEAAQVLGGGSAQAVSVRALADETAARALASEAHLNACGGRVMLYRSAPDYRAGFAEGWRRLGRLLAPLGVEPPLPARRHVDAARHLAARLAGEVELAEAALREAQAVRRASDKMVAKERVVEALAAARAELAAARAELAAAPGQGGSPWHSAVHGLEASAAAKREQLAVAEQGVAAVQLQQHQLGLEEHGLALTIGRAERVMATTQAGSPAHRTATQLRDQAVVQKAQLGGQRERLEAQARVAATQAELAGLQLEAEAAKRQALEAKRQSHPKLFEAGFTDAGGEGKETTTIRVVVKDGQLYSEHRNADGEVTGTHQLSWAHDAQLQPGRPRPPSWDHFEGRLVQLGQRLDAERGQALDLAAAHWQGQKQLAEQALAAARAAHGDGVKASETPAVVLVAHGGAAGSKGQARPQEVGPDWRQRGDGTWVHPEVAAAEAQVGQVAEELARTEQERHEVDFRRANAHLVRGEADREAALAAKYANDHAGVRQRHFDEYAGANERPVPLDPGVARRNALGAALGLAPKPGDAARDELYSDHERRLIDLVETVITTAVGPGAAVKPSLVLHTSAEQGVGVEQIIHLLVEGRNGDKALIDASMAEHLMAGKNLPWQFDNFDDWHRNNTLREAGQIYLLGPDGQMQGPLAAHHVTGQERIVDTAVEIGTIAAAVIPNPLARGAVYIGGTYLAGRGAGALAGMAKHGQKVWTKQALMHAAGVASAFLPTMAATMRVGATLRRLGPLAALRAGTGTLGRNATLNARAAAVFAKGGPALKAANAMDVTAATIGLPLMVEQLNTLANKPDLSTAEQLLAWLDLAGAATGALNGTAGLAGAATGALKGTAVLASQPGNNSQQTSAGAATGPMVLRQPRRNGPYQPTAELVLHDPDHIIIIDSQAGDAEPAPTPLPPIALVAPPSRARPTTPSGPLPAPAQLPVLSGHNTQNVAAGNDGMPKAARNQAHTPQPGTAPSTHEASDKDQPEKAWHATDDAFPPANTQDPKTTIAIALSPKLSAAFDGDGEPAERTTLHEQYAGLIKDPAELIDDPEATAAFLDVLLFDSAPRISWVHKPDGPRRLWHQLRERGIKIVFDASIDYRGSYDGDRILLNTNLLFKAPESALIKVLGHELGHMDKNNGKENFAGKRVETEMAQLSELLPHPVRKDQMRFGSLLTASPGRLLPLFPLQDAHGDLNAATLLLETIRYDAKAQSQEEGSAILTQLKIRQQIMDEGGPDIGHHGLEFVEVYEQYDRGEVGWAETTIRLGELNDARDLWDSSLGSYERYHHKNATDNNEKLNAVLLPPHRLGDLSAVELEAIDASEISLFSPDQVRALSCEQLGWLAYDQLRALTSEQRQAVSHNFKTQLQAEGTAILSALRLRDEMLAEGGPDHMDPEFVAVYQQYCNGELSLADTSMRLGELNDASYASIRSPHLLDQAGQPSGYGPTDPKYPLDAGPAFNPDDDPDTLGGAGGASRAMADIAAGTSGQAGSDDEPTKLPGSVPQAVPSHDVRGAKEASRADADGGGGINRTASHDRPEVDGGDLVGTLRPPSNTDPFGEAASREQGEDSDDGLEPSAGDGSAATLLPVAARGDDGAANADAAALPSSATGGGEPPKPPVDDFPPVAGGDLPQPGSNHDARPDDDLPDDPSERVRAWRLERGLSLRALAQRANIPASTLQQIETGERPIGLVMPKLAKGLEVTPGQIRGREWQDCSEPGQRLKVRREELGLRVSEVASRAGVDRDTVAQIEKGQRPIGIALANLANALDVTPDRLRGWGWEECEKPGARLRALREERELSLTELGVASGIDRRTISSIENGEREMRRQTPRLAAALGVDPDHLRGRSWREHTELGDRVRARREGLGWTEDDLAVRLSVSRQLIGKVETGAAQAVGVVSVERLAAKLGVGVAELQEGSRQSSAGSILREARKRLKLTQAEVAERAGISPASVWRLESGATQAVGAVSVERLAAMLGVGVVELQKGPSVAPTQSSAGSILREARKRLKLTQAEVAERAGISRRPSRGLRQPIRKTKNS